MKQRVLILCTGNSARSQMAEGLLRHDAGAYFDVESAGTQPSAIRPEAIAAMRELGIDISAHYSKHVDDFERQRFDCVLTVCDNANESCPVFLGAGRRIHRAFEDPPPPSAGSYEERLKVFRRIRDQLRHYLQEFIRSNADHNFCMVSPSPEVARLLATAPSRLPLIQAAFEPAVDSHTIRSQDAAILFPDARQQHAALAGLLLRLGRWPESHAVAQDIESPEGSYWHGIIHRLEPDSSNANYWFRRLGKHAIFADLHQRAAEILQSSGPGHWHLKNAWNPSLFIEWCEEAHVTGGKAEETAIDIQLAEWQLLFNWCASGPSPRRP